MVVNERIFFFVIYLYLATWSMECLLKNKEPFTNAYFFASFILHTINKNQLSLCKESLNAYHPDDMQEKALNLWANSYLWHAETHEISEEKCININVSEKGSRTCHFD